LEHCVSFHAGSPASFDGVKFGRCDGAAAVKIVDDAPLAVGARILS
jgi:hypothetical protein